jgi:selenoprotein W-related protein
MVGSLLEEFEHHIEEIVLVPSKGGVFEVTAGDRLLYSKKATGRHAEYEEVAAPLREMLAA